MGALNPEKKDPITEEGIRRSLGGYGDDYVRFSGGEKESFFTTLDLRLPTDEQHYSLTNDIRGDHSLIHYSDEPGTNMVEVDNREPASQNGIYGTPQEIQDQERFLSQRMEERDLKFLPYTCPSFHDGYACLQHIIGPRGEVGTSDYSDRPKTLLKAFKMHLPPEAVSYPVVNTCIHWTTGVKNPQEAFEIARLQVAMSPFFFIYTENRPPYQNGSDQRVTEHTGLKSRRALGNRGMYPDFLFAAKDHREFIDRTIERILETPMLAYFDHGSNLIAVPKGLEVKPSDMKGLGPENIGQFELAMSQFWYNYKTKAAPGGTGTLVERRDFDQGPEAFQDIMLVFSMIDHDETAKKRLIATLDKDYGIPLFSDPVAAHGVIRSNIDAALRRGTNGERFVNTPFGSEEKGKTVHDLLADTLLPMMRQYHGSFGMNHMLASWEYKAETGMTNAQYWHDLYNSMDHQRGHTIEMMQEPGYHEHFFKSESWPQQRAENSESVAVPSVNYV